MGRGGKKKGKKVDEELAESVSDLKLTSEQGASTSQQESKAEAKTEQKPTEPPKETPEEDGGLGLDIGGGRKRQRKKKPSLAAAAAATQQGQPQTSTPDKPQLAPPQGQLGTQGQPGGPPQLQSGTQGHPEGPPQPQWGTQGHPGGPPQPQPLWGTQGHPGGPPQPQWGTQGHPGGPPQPQPLLGTQGHPEGTPQPQWGTQGHPGGPPQPQWGTQGHPGGPPQPQPLLGTQGHPEGTPQPQWGTQGHPGGPPQPQWGTQGHPGGPPQPQPLWGTQGHPGGPPQPQPLWGTQRHPGGPPQPQWGTQGHPGGPPQPQPLWGTQGHPGGPRQPQPQRGTQGQPGGPAQPQPQWGAQGQPRGPLQGQGHPGVPPQGQEQPRSAPQSQPKTPQAAAGDAAQGRPSTGAQKKAPSQVVKPGQQPSRFTVPAKILGKRVSGRPVDLLVNYLPMKIEPRIVHRYDVSFNPERPKKYLARVFQEAMRQNFPKHLVAFDQMKNFYAPEALPKISQTDRYIMKVTIKDDGGKEMTFEVSFKGTGTVDFKTLIQYMTTQSTSLNPPTEAIQCVDVILRQGTLQSYVKAGRTFFKRPARPVILGDGLEMWTGLFQSAIFTTRPFVNIDVAHKGFPIAQNMLQVLECFRLNPNGPLKDQRGGYLNFTQFIKGLRVVAGVGGSTEQKLRREYLCNELREPANKQRFQLNTPDGRTRTITVADYFADLGKRLRYPNLECMWVGPRDKSIFIPLELLDVAFGQVRNKQLNEMQLSTMVREAATPPDQRKKKIEEVIKDMNYGSNPYFSKFGLQISDQFTPIKGKIIDPPKLECGGGFKVIPRRGVWNADRLTEGKQLLRWGVIAIDIDKREACMEDLVALFLDVSRKMGMSLSKPELEQGRVSLRGGPAQLGDVMAKARDLKLQLLVVVVPSRGADAYSQVKKTAERSVGLLTQCIKQTTLRRLNPQTIKNILLKVNGKLTGTNQILEAGSVPPCLAKGNVMVVGADVTHPSPDQSNIPSIAAVTASLDKNCFKYNIAFSIQTPRKEMIVQFEDMMVDHLKAYHRAQGRPPARVFVFRDGVSEGQFEQVMRCELAAVYAAFTRLGAPRPEVMFLLVQKRHHTRFFLRASPQNVEPGTVVDSDIVHPRELDFYLVSHQAIKGTARPTRYHAVCNDGAVPADEVQQLAYYLCHLYGRCMRSVSYPAPTYYAHLGCMRARALTYNEKFDNDELEREPKRLRVKIHDENPMFFI